MRPCSESIYLFPIQPSSYNMTELNPKLCFFATIMNGLNSSIETEKIFRLDTAQKPILC